MLTSPRGRLLDRNQALTLAVAGSCLAVVGLWWLSVLQRPAPVWLSRSLVLVALLLITTRLIATLVAAWRQGSADEGSGRRRVLVLLAITVISLAVHLVGIEHEVAEAYYDDEGTYRHHADQINQGNYLRDSYFYPHLLYYLNAFATWLAALFAGPLLALSERLYGISEWSVFCRLLGRAITASMAGLTAIPIFRAAERLWGLYAGLIAGLLIALAPVYNQGGHINIADVPSAFFAALCFGVVARLVQRERRSDYVLAGIYAGLAAGTKYPAGVVAIAIIAVYLKWRLSERRFSWGLAWAGLPSLAVFLLTTPGLVLTPQAAIFGNRGALFGFRQYSGGAWIGVVVDSNWRYYFDLIVDSFAWPAVLLGLSGLLLLRGQQARDALWMAPFPFGFLALIASMNIVVERNLYPALPPLAVFLGAGIAAWGARSSSWQTLRSAAFKTALAVLCLAPPLVAVVAQDIAYTSDSTRQVGARWAAANLPTGASFLKERYTPNLDLKAFEVEKTRWIGSYSLDELVAANYDFVVLASDAFERFLRPELHFREYHAVAERNYREVLALDPVLEVLPHRTRMGPRILLFELPPPEVSDLQVLDARKPLRKRVLNRLEQVGRIPFAPTHWWRILRATLPAGQLQLSLTGRVEGYAHLSVIDLQDREVAYVDRTPEGTFDLEIERAGRYILRFYWAKTSQPETLVIERAGDP
ncbi:MAG: glycosyltransferase family 39 protein [Acidobacteriota bacterium]